jgi:lipopolysaccharide assembly outer membrane protein LptD (OstA)
MAPQAAPQEEAAEPSGDQEGGDESAPQPQGGTSHSATGGYEREIARLSLLQAYDIEHAVTPAGSKLSDMELDASVFPTTIAQFGSSLGYNPDSERITFANVYLALRPPWAKPSPLYMGRAVAGPFLEISYNFVGGNNAAQTFSARAYYELFDRLGIFYAPLYDIAGGKLLSAEYGVRIKSECNCWALDLGISDTTNPNELQFQFQVTLGGLGSVGQSPFGSNPFRNYYGGSSGVIPRLN